MRVKAHERKRLEQLCCTITLPALVPRPRLHLIRFQGVLAPDAKLRSRVVRQGPPTQPPPKGRAREPGLNFAA